MFTRRKKGSNSGPVKLENRLLRLLRSDAGLQAPLTCSRKAHQEDAFDIAQKGVGAAMWEAEYRKAESIMTMERNRRFC